MKKSCSFVLMFLFLCSLQVETGAITKINTSITMDKNNNARSLEDYVKYMEVKERNQPIISLERLEEYDEDSIIEEADLIVRGTVTNKTEVSFLEYRNNQQERTVYKDLLTLRINKILMRDETNTELTEGESINIYNDISEHNWHINAMKIDKDNEYILFLKKAKDDGIINYTSYGSYVINAPDWAVVLKENNRYFYDKKFGCYEYLSEGQKNDNENNNRSLLISSKFEDRLSESIISFIKSSNRLPEGEVVSQVDMNMLDSSNVEEINLKVFFGEKRTIKARDEINKVIELLKSIKIIDSNTAGVPVRIPGYYIEVVYKGGNGPKTEEFRILKNAMNYAAWDKNYKNLSFGNYRVEKDITKDLKLIHGLTS
jgi:predicted  nucleic acid-binding Zn-ribbon protein